VKSRYEGWGWNINLELFWTQREVGFGKHGLWNSARALLWLRDPPRVLASIVIRDKKYAIHTQGLFGMTDEQRKALVDHLNGMGLAEREKNDGI
jgi:hypothetical protein